MLWDWWPQEVSEKLQQFYDDLVNGQRPKVAIMAPPQHGKSTAATDFVTWVAGKDPNLKTIFASFSDQLGERTNKEVQRIMRTDAYIKIFGRTCLESASGTRPAPRSTKSLCELRPQGLQRVLSPAAADQTARTRVCRVRPIVRAQAPRRADLQQPMPPAPVPPAGTIIGFENLLSRPRCRSNVTPEPRSRA
jgi:hypothetical protein